MKWEINQEITNTLVRYIPTTCSLNLALVLYYFSARLTNGAHTLLSTSHADTPQTYHLLKTNTGTAC